MGNKVGLGEIVDAKINESKQICSLDKTTSPWQKTKLYQTKDEGLFVIKQLLKCETSTQFELLRDKLSIQHNSIQSETKHPNLLGYFNQSPVKFNQEFTILLRQYVTFNLTEKLELLPQQLMQIEKYWLIFQILCGLTQLHSIPQMAHGDLKPANILVSSFDWVFIVDINPLKPVQVLDTDLKTYNLYFGDLDNNNRCYLAPERWITPPQTIDENAILEPAMDVFSCGCIIAEILSDGIPLFDLPKLQQYRHSGKFRPEEALKNSVRDPQLIRLIMEMIDLSPANRPTASQCLDRWNELIFPESFHTIFFQLSSQCFCLQYLYADNRLSLFRYYADAIFYKCFNIKDGARTQGFSIPIDDQTFRLLQLDNLEERNRYIVPSQFKLCNRNMLNNGGEWLDSDWWEQLSDNQRQLSKESALIVINWIGSQISGCFNQQDKLAALEMIQKLAKYQSFDVRLNRILPYVAQAFGFDSQEKQTAVNRQEAMTQSQVRIKALETLLSLFEDVIDTTERVMMPPSEFKVFQNYIMPIINKLMDTTKTSEGGPTGQGQGRGDETVRHAIANNLALITKVGIRCIEIAQATSIQLREEIRQRKSNPQKIDLPETDNFQRRTQSMLDSLEETKIIQKRMTIARTKGNVADRKTQKDLEVIEEEFDEVQISTKDIQAPNYDTEVVNVTKDIIQLIQNFSGENTDPNSLVAMLSNLIELSQFFDHNNINDLFQYCIHGMNNENQRVRLQAIKTLMSLSVRLGQKIVHQKIFPIIEHIISSVFEDDLFVVETLKFCNLLVILRLLKQNECETILDLILPFTVHPNRQIRDCVVKYVFVLATLGHSESAELPLQDAKDAPNATRINYKKGPLYSQVEFYAKIRPKLLPYLTENSQGRRDITVIKKIEDIKERLRPPLPLRVLLKCLKDPAELQRDHNPQDSFALEALGKMITNKLKQRNRQQPDEKSKNVKFELQQRPRNRYYRLIKAASLAQLMKLEIFDSFSFLSIQKDQQKPAHKLKSQSKKNLSFEPTKLISLDRREALNFGQNKTFDEVRQTDYLMTPEMQTVVDSLELQKDRAQIKTMVAQNQQLTLNLGILKSLKVDQELRLPALAAQPSVLPHFENTDADQIQTIKVSDELRRKGKPTPYSQHKFQGTLVTTLYEHTNPVNTVSVADDSNFFFTGSREDRKVCVWKVANIEQDITSRPVLSFNSGMQINQVSSLQNSQAIAVAGSQGVNIYDTTRILQDSQDANNAQPNCVTSIQLNDPTDEVNSIVNMVMPFANKQHIFCAATQKGALLIHDIRAQQNVLFEEHTFANSRGAVSCMAIGYEPYQLTVGTLGGYLMVYDVRYNLTSALYKHDMNYPVLALATSRPKDGQPSTLVSTGGPVFEMSQVNLETGGVEILFRCVDSKNGVESLRKNDLITVPEFVKETTFQDSYLSTIRRESSFRQFNRSLMSVRNHVQFNNLINQTAMHIKNIDSQLMETSSQRYKLIHDSYLSPNACRTILVPRNNIQSMLFDGTTAAYAITAGNDKKIRYWSFNDPKKQSIIINSPTDDEVQYSQERGTKDTVVVMERSLAQKEFPILTQQRLKDQSNSALYQYVTINGQSTQIKYPGNSSYNNIVAGVIQQRQAQPGQTAQTTQPRDISGRKQEPISESERILGRLQIEDMPGSQVMVNNLNGLAIGQHMNDLSIIANGAVETLPGQLGQALNTELLREKVIRSNEIVSHTDAILDIAQIEFRTSQQSLLPLLVSTSRDCTVKIWR